MTSQACPYSIGTGDQQPTIVARPIHVTRSNWVSILKNRSPYRPTVLAHISGKPVVSTHSPVKYYQYSPVKSPFTPTQNSQQRHYHDDGDEVVAVKMLAFGCWLSFTWQLSSSLCIERPRIMKTRHRGHRHIIWGCACVVTERTPKPQSRKVGRTRDVEDIATLDMHSQQTNYKTSIEVTLYSEQLICIEYSRSCHCDFFLPQTLLG